MNEPADIEQCDCAAVHYRSMDGRCYCPRAADPIADAERLVN